MRRYDRSAVKKIVKDQVVRSATAIVQSIDCYRVNITLGNSSSLIRGVEVVGDAKKIVPGSVVPITWREGRPVVLQTVGKTDVPTAVAESTDKNNSYPTCVYLDPFCGYTPSSSPPLDYADSSMTDGEVYFMLDSDGDYIEFSFGLAAGTYNICVFGLTKASGGIIQIYMDGVFLAEQDRYSSAVVGNVKWNTPVSIQQGGIHKLRFQVNGHNASATNYRLWAKWICINQTSS